MTISLHTVSVGTYLQNLPALAGLIDKAAAHCEAQGLGAEALSDARLAPDMWNFAKQVTSATHHSAGAIMALLGSGEFSPDLSPPPLDFAGLRRRVSEAIGYLQGIDAATIEAKAGSDMEFVFGERRMPFTAEDFILTFSLPNFYFHSTSAYAVLRNQGLAIGKMDYMGRPRLKG
jgi:hypothetical protein